MFEKVSFKDTMLQIRNRYRWFFIACAISLLVAVSTNILTATVIEKTELILSISQLTIFFVAIAWLITGMIVLFAFELIRTGQDPPGLE